MLLELIIPKTTIAYKAPPQVVVEVVLEEPIVEEVDEILCSCIKYARSIGVNLPYNTNASDVVANSRPTIGGLVLLDYGNIEHVAIIQEFTDTGFKVKESNYRKCKETERIIQFDSPFIRGFYSDKIDPSDVESGSKL